MNIQLLKATRASISADSSSTRQDIFKTLVRNNPIINLVVILHNFLDGTFLSTLMVSLYGIKSAIKMMPPSSVTSQTILSIASQSNAGRKIQEISEIIGGDTIKPINLTSKSIMTKSTMLYLISALASAKLLIKYFKTIDVINNKYDFLVSCRVASTIGSYLRSDFILSRSPANCVMVSSDSNPEELGTIYSAKNLSKKVIYLSHAYPTALSSPLEYDLSIVEGQAALDQYARKAEPIGNVLLAGLPGESRYMKSELLLKANPIIGIFTPKTLNWEIFNSIINECLFDLNAKEILIRWHPSLLDHKSIKSIIVSDGRVKDTPTNYTAAQVADYCDWIITDANSNVHLDVLRIGKPTISIQGLRPLRHENNDIYEFVSNGLIFPPAKCIKEIDLKDASIFYSGEWCNNLKYYDANYLKPKENYVIAHRNAIANMLV